MNIIDQVIRASRPAFDTKGGAVAYYQNAYGTGKVKNSLTWKKNLVSDLLIVDGTPPNISKEEFKRLSKNKGKRFEKRISEGANKKNPEYAHLARLIGARKAPPGGYHVHFDGELKFSECEERSFDVDITGALADEVAMYPDRVLEIAIMIYMQLEGMREETPGVGDCSQPYITITANPDDHKPKEVKQHKAARQFFKKR